MSRPHATESVYMAISHPIRRQILDLLKERDRTVMEIGQQFKATMSTVSQHLQILRFTGLVSQRRRGRQRIYTLHARILSVPIEWLRRYESDAMRRAVRVKR